jgi:hypothetical protein
MVSWFTHNPSKEITKLNKSILVVQGTSDIQVSVDHVKSLVAANMRAQLVGIGNMNHIFKTAPADRQAKVMTYSHPDLPIKTELLSAIKHFIDPH